MILSYGDICGTDIIKPDKWIRSRRSSTRRMELIWDVTICIELICIESENARHVIGEDVIRNMFGIRPWRKCAEMIAEEMREFRIMDADGNEVKMYDCAGVLHDGIAFRFTNEAGREICVAKARYNEKKMYDDFDRLLSAASSSRLPV